MNAPPGAEQTWRALVDAADAVIANREGAISAAMNPALRPSLEANHAFFMRWASDTRMALAKVEQANRVMGKALRITRKRRQL